MGGKKEGGHLTPLLTPHLWVHIFAHLVTCIEFLQYRNYFKLPNLVPSNLAKIWARERRSEKGGETTRLPLPTPSLGAHTFAHLITCTKFAMEKISREKFLLTSI